MRLRVVTRMEESDRPDVEGLDFPDVEEPISLTAALFLPNQDIKREMA